MDERRRLVRAAVFIAVAGAYVLFARLGLALDPVGGFATLVWAPSGIAIACLVRFGAWLWPAVTIGAFVINAWSGAPLAAAATIALGNTLEAVAGAHCLRRFRTGAGPISSVRDAFALLGAALCSPLVSASIGVSALVLTSVVPASRAALVWSAWWIGDVLGALVVAPVLLNWKGLSGLAGMRGRALEASLLYAAVAGSALLSFSGDAGARLQRPHLIFPALIWAAIRFGPGVASVCVLIISVIAIGLTASGTGFYASARLHENLTALQGFMGTVATTGIFLAATNAERAAAQLERERVLADLRAALVARDDFLSVASHELRTPLTALDLQLQIAKRTLETDVAGADGGKLGRKIEIAARQVQRLSLLIDGLLNVSRIATGRFRLEREDLDLVTVIRDVVERFEEEATRAGSAITTRIPDSAPGHWDKTRMDQALTNLISNAIKYGSSKPIEVALLTAADSVELRVQDHGIGVAPSDAARIFERYERAVSAKHFGGLGLGLYITREIVTAHGGTIAVMSEPAAGTTFAIKLPRRAL